MKRLTQEEIEDIKEREPKNIYYGLDSPSDILKLLSHIEAVEEEIKKLSCKGVSSQCKTCGKLMPDGPESINKEFLCNNCLPRI